MMMDYPPQGFLLYSNFLHFQLFDDCIDLNPINEKTKFFNNS